MVLEYAGVFVDGVWAAVGEVSGGGGLSLFGGAPICVGTVVGGPVGAHDLCGHVPVGGVHNQAPRVRTKRVGDRSTVIVLGGVGHQLPGSQNFGAQHQSSKDAGRGKPNISHDWLLTQSGYSLVISSNNSRSDVAVSVSRPKSCR